MNVIIANRYKELMNNLPIEIIKLDDGEFSVDEIINQYQNFYFQRMILDITAIKNYQDINTLQRLSISLNMDKVILLLDDSPEMSSTDFLSKLISMGIYNFTKNIEGIMYLYNNPNSYRDVAHIHQLYPTKEVVVEKFVSGVGTKVIGIKNITKSSGATTLVYMMKKQLSKNYSVTAIEVDKNDFRFFMDKTLISTTDNQIGNTIAKNHDSDIILVDINDSENAFELCHEVIYLIEPSIIKLNKLMITNPKALAKYKNEKIILNQSVLTSKDVLDFEYESKLKIFYNMPPLDERERNIHPLNAFLVRLGFDKQEDGEVKKKNSILGLFNFKIDK